jgi:LuxR family transcriptional regulator, maltose regulon positive regulatory protein
LGARSGALVALWGKPLCAHRINPERRRAAAGENPAAPSMNPSPNTWLPPAESTLTVERGRIAPLGPAERIVAIVAPAGYGKSTLAAAWFRQCVPADRAVWVTFDASWTDPVYFVQNLLGAVDPASTEGAETIDGPAAVETGLSVLVRLLAARVPRFTFFFDDAHLLRGSDSAAALTRLMLAAPAHVGFVLCGRDAMELELPALTARNLVRWVTQRDLRFDAAEVRQLAHQRLSEADEQCVDRVLASTEGWPALVQLALAGGAALPGGADSDLLMDSFIYEHFFKTLSLQRRQALFAMAAVGEFTQSLLRLLGVEQVEGAIEEGETLGIVQRRGRSDGELRYALHPLLADQALLRFAGVCAQGADALRSRCADWWAERGDSYRGFRLAMAAQDPARAARVLRAYAPELVQQQGRHETYVELLGQLEARHADLDAELMLQAVWAYAFLRNWVEAQRWLERIERWLAAQAPGATPDAVRHTTVLQRATIAGLRDDANSTLAFAGQWLATAGDAGGSAGPMEDFQAGIAHTAMAYAKKCESSFSEAFAHLRSAQARFEHGRTPYGLMWVHVVSTAASIKSGRHRDALAATASALQEGDAYGPGISGHCAMLHAMRAMLLYERDERGAALAEIEAALQLLPHQGVVDAMVAGYVAASRLQAANADLSGALDMLAEGERVGIARGFQRLQLTLVAERALLLLRSGDAPAAQRLAEDYGLVPGAAPSGLVRDKSQRLWSRLALAHGEPAQALALADAGISRARATSQQYKLAEFLMLRAMATARLGDAPSAGLAVLESLRIAAQHGYLRLYVDEGSEFAALLRRTAAQPQAPSPALAQAQRVLAALQDTASAPNEQQLTERERRLVGMLAEGMSNSEVATRLVLTEGTVKWHLHNLYVKLGVRNRTSALREARSRGIL